MEDKLRKSLTRGVSTGELMAHCRKAERPDCPWVPESLRNARVVELGPDAAVASVTTPAGMTSWLALRKQGENWRVVGRAVMENMARAFAQAGQAKAAPAARPRRSSPPPRLRPSPPPRATALSPCRQRQGRRRVTAGCRHDAVRAARERPFFIWRQPVGRLRRRPEIHPSGGWGQHVMQRGGRFRSFFVQSDAAPGKKGGKGPPGAGCVRRLS